MFKITSIAFVLILSCSLAQAGFLGNQMAYSGGGFPSPAEHHYKTVYGANYGANYGAPYAAPLPVAPLSGHHPYAGVGYSASPVVKFHSNGGGFDCNPFTTYASVRSHHKFAFPAPVPSVYNAPPPVSFDSPAVSYNGFEVPNTVVKFGPPITTTTTTYSTVSAGRGVPVGNPLNAVPGW